jgi:hypothetical protein
VASTLAALHVQYLNDPVVLDSVNDIETLAGGLSYEIWQKITTLDVMCRPALFRVLPSKMNSLQGAVQ